MGHLGLTPQSIHKFGTYVVRAKERKKPNGLRKMHSFSTKQVALPLYLKKFLQGWPKMSL